MEAKVEPQVTHMKSNYKTRKNPQNFQAVLSALSEKRRWVLDGEFISTSMFDPLQGEKDPEEIPFEENRNSEGKEVSFLCPY